MQQKMWMLWAILGFDWLNVYKYLSPPSILRYIFHIKPHFSIFFYCEVIFKRILIIFTPEEAEIFKDYLFIFVLMQQKMWMLWAILGFDWLNVYKYLDETIVPFLRKGVCVILYKIHHLCYIFHIKPHFSIFFIVKSFLNGF
jgi:hypothetical protein